MVNVNPVNVKLILVMETVVYRAQAGREAMPGWTRSVPRVVVDRSCQGVLDQASRPHGVLDQASRPLSVLG